VLPPRARDSHKGDFGAVGVLGGAPGMAGAALLAGRAALACGAGRVHVGLLDRRIAFDPLTPELMLRPARAMPPLPTPACLVTGPGLGDSAQALRCLADALDVPHALLLDADALNLLARDADLLAAVRTRGPATIVTPHPGEAARLLRCTAADIQGDRAGAVRALVDLTGAIVVLKGAGTLIAAPDALPVTNTTGNPGMAAPGMGDALCGIIAALIAQGMPASDAAIAGVHLHGAAGDAAVARGHGPRGLTASRLIEHARRLLNGLGASDCG
jgi:hydroxyethylthiazole kinase-like uncharacterized protein yjeF